MKKRIIVLTSALWMLFGTMIVNADWIQDQSGWKFQKGTSFLSSEWVEIAGKWYYFDENGYMKTGWFQDINKKWYYLSSDGSMKTGWFQDINGKWYYFNSDGSMKTGWHENSDGKWYYFNDLGEMAVNTRVDGYKIGADGAMIAGTLTTYTAEQIKNKNLSSYTAGTKSVYGSKLTQAELNEVAEVVANFMSQYVTSDLDTVEKILLAHNYLAYYCSYAETWAENGANTAWGALVYHEAQCSGYARAMKALCDAMDVNCYYVHADENALNPSHQWNMVEVDGKWYIVDVQANDSSGGYFFFLCGEDDYPMTYDKSLYPACSSTGYDLSAYYEY